MKSIFLAIFAAFVLAGEEYQRLKDVEATKGARLPPVNDDH